jgi:sugar transferase (PEP-CTERM/EpsH1 system associated)
VKILALTHRLPWAPNRGDRIRVYHMLRALGARHEVHLLSLVHDDDEESHVHEVRTWLPEVRAVRVPRVANLLRAGLKLPTSTPLTFVLLNAPNLRRELAAMASSVQADAVFAYCSSMARLLLDPAVVSLPSIIDMIDMDSAKWQELGLTTAPPMAWVYRRESRLLARAEAVQMRHAHATMVVNHREASTAREIAPDADIRVVEIGIDLDRFAPTGPPADSSRVIFCGVMSYLPNTETAIRLAQRVWPLVRKRHPRATLALVGSDPPASLKRLGTVDSSIIVTGHVSDVRSWLWESAVAAAPIRTARGVQNKVLEAVAAGLPCVISSAVAAGLPAEVLAACEVADDVQCCADQISTLLEMSPDARRARARIAVLDHLSWTARLQPILELFDEIDSSRARR